MDNLHPDHFTRIGSFTKSVHRDVYPSIDALSPALSQEGKIILITGASRGIGKTGFAATFAKAKPRGIVITARTLQSLDAKVTAIQDLDSSIEVLPLALEISDESSVKAAFAKMKEVFGTVDVLISNAATSQGSRPVKEANVNEWWVDYESNVKGHMLLAMHFFTLLGPSKPGTIIELTAPLSLMVVPGTSGYATSKIATMKLVAFMAAENPNVTAVALHPGIVLTDMVPPEAAILAKDSPELAGGVALWLTTDEARFLNGRYMNANWDVNEMIEKRAQILEKNLLTLGLSGEFQTAKVVRNEKP